MTNTITEIVCNHFGDFNSTISKGFYSLLYFEEQELEKNLKELISYIGQEYQPSYTLESIDCGTLIILAYNYNNKTIILNTIFDL